MQRQLSLSDSEDAISPVIGTVLILAIMVSITGTMLAWGIPQIQQSEAYAIYTSAQNNFLNFDADLDQVIVQGEGSSRSSTVSFSAGTFVHRENLDEIRYYYETTSVPFSAGAYASPLPFAFFKSFSRPGTNRPSPTTTVIGA